MSARQWKRFGRKIRPNNTELLAELPNFPNAILVAGCQRSGGTMLAKAITQHEDVDTFSWSKDAELDAAQLLSGTAAKERVGFHGSRYCFQTTYLNERFIEYSQHIDSIHLIWLIRNPHSVVFSMLHNWKRFALNEVFISCGLPLVSKQRRAKFNRYGVLAVPPIERACYAYLGKLRQANVLFDSLPDDRFTTCEYEDLVQKKPEILSKLFSFAGLSNSASYTQPGGEISSRSMNKADRLSESERTKVDSLCLEPYRDFQENRIRVRSE